MPMIQLPSHLGSFLGVVGLLTITPGPDTVLVVRNVIAGKWDDGLATAFGSSVGLIVWGVASAFGISALFTLSALSFAVLRSLGAGYLAYLGVRLLWRAITGQSAPTENRNSAGPNATFAASFRQGLFTNLLNPKAAAFFSALLPQFISTKVDPVFSTTIIYACIASSSALVGLSVYALLAARAKALLSHRNALRALDALTGAAFVTIAGRLALKET